MEERVVPRGCLVIIPYNGCRANMNWDIIKPGSSYGPEGVLVEPGSVVSGDYFYIDPANNAEYNCSFSVNSQGGLNVTKTPTGQTREPASKSSNFDHGYDIRHRMRRTGAALVRSSTWPFRL